MESQPTIETVIEKVAPWPTITPKDSPIVPPETISEPGKPLTVEERVEASSKLLPNFLQMFTGAVMDNLARPAAENVEPVAKAESSGPSNKLDLNDIVKLASPLLPLIRKALLNALESEGIGHVPSFRSRKAKTNSLVVQIIVGKWTFLVTRSGKNEYKVSYRQDTIFQKKTVSSKGLYLLLKTLTNILDENIHFGLIFNKSTLENRVLEPNETDKKTLKAHIRYFLCLL